MADLKRVLDDYLVESVGQIERLSSSLFAAGMCSTSLLSVPPSAMSDSIRGCAVLTSDGEVSRVLAQTGKPEAEREAEMQRMKEQFAAKMKVTLASRPANPTKSHQINGLWSDVWCRALWSGWRRCGRRRVSSQKSCSKTWSVTTTVFGVFSPSLFVTEFRFCCVVVLRIEMAMV